MRHQIYQNETFQIMIRALDSNREPVDLSTVETFEFRLRFPTGTVTYPCSYDSETHIISVNVDRDVTATWTPGSYRFQFWIDNGEGASPIENDMLYEDILLVQRALT